MENKRAKQVLILGPSGAGKTYISANLREKGINAVDADLIEGLGEWYDGEGKRVEFHENAGKEFLDSHPFLWDEEILKRLLKENDELYLFGMAGNAFDFVSLFDKVYFLKAKPETLAERLNHSTRENPMGKTEYQLQNALQYAKEIEETAAKMGLEIIDAEKTPEDIFSKIMA